MYNLLILMLASIYIFLPEKKVGTKSPQQCAGISLKSAGFSFWLRVGSAVWTERNLIQVG